MKMLRIIILIELVVSFIPLDACCEDHHESAEQHQGIIICHASCCPAAVIINTALINTSDIKVYTAPSNGFTYEAPYLHTESRPPITLS
jgi:hypothetical protein